MTTQIKFFYNGIKLNGEKSLIKCKYRIEKAGSPVSILADSYGEVLPRDIFQVTNDTDSMTDYFDHDHTTISPYHPLYKFAAYVAAKAEVKLLQKHIAYLEKMAKGNFMPESYQEEAEQKKKWMENLQSILASNPGHPKESDITAAREFIAGERKAKQEEETRRKEAQKAELERQQTEGTSFILRTMEQLPITENAPKVTIHWSEHPAFYAWENNTLHLSPAAADIILNHFDEKPTDGFSYYKTKFSIMYTDEHGEYRIFTDRYDLGDKNGGLIAYILDLAKHAGTATGRTSELYHLANQLQSNTLNGKIINIYFGKMLVNS